MLSELTALTLLTTLAAAGTTSSNPAPWTWQVRGFSSVCTAATCRYSFNVSGPTGPWGQSSFDASGCVGTSVQGRYKSCAVVDVYTRGNVQTQEFNHGIDVGASVSVQYTFQLIGYKFTYTGNHSIAHTGNGPAVDFTITPTEASAVLVER